MAYWASFISKTVYDLPGTQSEFTSTDEHEIEVVNKASATQLSVKEDFRFPEKLAKMITRNVNNFITNGEEN